MARYYNKQSGSLAVSLRSGESLSIAGRTWVDIPAQEEGSEDLLRAVRLNYLYRFDPGPENEAAPVPVPTVSEPVPEEPEVMTDDPPVSVNLEDSPESAPLSQ